MPRKSQHKNSSQEEKKTKHSSTADLDFPRLLALSLADGPGIILFRGGNYSDVEICELLDNVLSEVPADVLEASICVVDKKRMRVTRLPLERKP